MNKTKVLYERLSECNVEIDEIIRRSLIDIDCECSVYIYISRFDGLGNKDSDFDVYVMVNDERRMEASFCKIGNASCDIEYWPVSEVIGIINDRKYEEDLSRLKLIKRIRSGIEIVDGNNELKKRIESISENELDEYVRNLYKLSANSEYDDAVKLFKNEEYISCLSCCQKSVDYILGSISAQNNCAVCNIKWAPKLFVQNNGYGDHEMLKRYLNTFVYRTVNCNNIKDVAQDMVNFLSDNLTRNTLFSWE